MFARAGSLCLRAGVRYTSGREASLPLYSVRRYAAREVNEDDFTELVNKNTPFIAQFHASYCTHPYVSSTAASLPLCPHLFRSAALMRSRHSLIAFFSVSQPPALHSLYLLIYLIMCHIDIEQVVRALPHALAPPRCRSRSQPGEQEHRSR